MSRSVAALALAALLSADCIARVPGIALPTDRAPAFALEAHDGRTTGLADGRAAGPAVVVFYRGHW